MYTYNVYVFGHDLSLLEGLPTKLSEIQWYFQEKINEQMFELSFPYHGMAVTPPIVFGCIVTDGKYKEHVKELREAKEEDYRSDYQTFLDDFMMCLEAYRDDLSEHFENFKKFLSDNEPTFYAVNVSS